MALTPSIRSTRTRAPAVLIEFAYHDNADDAAWLVSHEEAIAQNVVRSLTRYFGIPFLSPARPLPARILFAVFLPSEPALLRELRRMSLPPKLRL